jgi:hypothetical protein
MIGYQEVKQCKEEWGVVVQKLANVGKVVVDVGEMCRMHDLKEEELPPNLRDVLGSLERCVSYLNEMVHVLITLK